MTTTAPSRPSADALRELDTTLSGRVLTPVDVDFAATAQGWNLAVQSSAFAVACVRSAQDVARVVRFAAEYGLEVEPQATGHGSWRHDRPVLTVDTSGLDEVFVDPAGHVRVGAGVQWSRVLPTLAEAGLMPLVGSAPDVGVVGYLTGGGVSPIGRGIGFASDLVTAFDVVTGDGEVRRATATENADLFWGLRGGKGALGIVTAVEFDVLVRPTVVGGCLYFDGADATHVAHTWREWSLLLPDEATTSLAVLRLPPLPQVPEPLAGRCTVAIRFGWTGDPDAVDDLLAPVRALGEPVFGGIGPLTAAELGVIHADPVESLPAFESHTLLSKLPAAGLDALLGVVGPDAQCSLFAAEIRRLEGGFARTPQHPDALSHRDAEFSWFAGAVITPEELDAVTAAADRALEAIAPWADGLLPNFSPGMSPAVMRGRYDDTTLARLADLTEVYDPHQVMVVGRLVREAVRSGR